MEWNALYDQNTPPNLDNINEYINSDLWLKLNFFLESTYQIQPKFSFSRCSMQPGWNLKYKKSGKSLCTLYPMKGFFIALVVIGNKENFETELMLSSFSRYIQNLYLDTPFSLGGHWLMINVTDAEILDDVISLIQIRTNSK